MKSVLRFGDGLRQAEIREDGPSENFYNQNVVAVNRQTDADKIRIFHYLSLYGSSGCGIPHTTGFYFPRSMAKEIAEALLQIAGESE